MAIVRPFKAIRPTRDKANLVATRSYLSYSDETLKEKLEHNPFTFLHIINPNIKQKGKNKFNAVKAKFNDFKEAGFFITEDTESFYIYQQINESQNFEGIIGATAVADYLNGNIKNTNIPLPQGKKCSKATWIRQVLMQNLFYCVIKKIQLLLILFSVTK